MFDGRDIDDEFREILKMYLKAYVSLSSPMPKFEGICLLVCLYTN